MNKISISHNHNHEKDKACHKAELMLEELADKYGLDIESDGIGNITFSGSGIDGEVNIDQNQITIKATLGFLMIAMKPVISNEISSKLKNIFS